MEAEMLGGPVDGLVMDVPDDAGLWFVRMPPMSATEFIAADQRPELMEFATAEPREFAYRKTDKLSVSGRRTFLYQGERVRK